MPAPTIELKLEKATPLTPMTRLRLGASPRGSGAGGIAASLKGYRALCQDSKAVERVALIGNFKIQHPKFKESSKSKLQSEFLEVEILNFWGLEF
jgi:hypothetical protein